MAPFDCELLRSGFPAQPINTVTSFAFIVAGVMLGVRGGMARQAVAIAAVGAGSIAFHGRPGSVAGFAHDATIIAALVIVAWPALRPRYSWAAGAGAAIPLISTVAPLVGGAGLAGRLMARRSSISRWALVFLAAGWGLWFASRTDGLLCNPGSPLQLHGVWHLLGATGLALAALAIDAPEVRSSYRQ